MPVNTHINARQRERLRGVFTIAGWTFTFAGVAWIAFVTCSPPWFAAKVAGPATWVMTFIFFSRLVFAALVAENFGSPQARHHYRTLFLRSLLFIAAAFFGGIVASYAQINPMFGWILGVVAIPVLKFASRLVYGFFRLFARIEPTPPVDMLIRGTGLLSFAQARAIADSLPRGKLPPIYWGGLELPDSVSEGHFLVAGATGSGKTLTLRLMMQSVLPHIGPGHDIRAFVYDAKRDILPILQGMKLDCPVKTLNPFDGRGVAWDIARDVTDDSTARQIASILVPPDNGPNNFFTNAARDLLAGTMHALLSNVPEKWTLRDVLLIMEDLDRLEALLRSCVHTKSLVKTYLLKEKTAQDIFSSISTHVFVFRPIAALWEHAKEKISLGEWTTSDSILVLGNDESLRFPLDAMNRVIFQRVSELVLNRTNSRTRRTWFIVDEAADVGKLKVLKPLIEKARSLGIRIVLGFQDIDGIREAYGEHAGNVISGICANKALLRLDSVGTAKWASENIGEALIKEHTQSFSTSSGPGGGSSSASTSEHLALRGAVLPSEFLRMPTVKNMRFEGLYITPAIGTYRATVDFSKSLEKTGRSPDYIRRPPDYHNLTPWSREDATRLGVPWTPDPQSQPLPTPPPEPSTVTDFVPIPRVTANPSERD